MNDLNVVNKEIAHIREIGKKSSQCKLYHTIVFYVMSPNIFDILPQFYFYLLMSRSHIFVLYLFPISIFFHKFYFHQVCNLKSNHLKQLLLIGQHTPNVDILISINLLSKCSINRKVYNLHPSQFCIINFLLIKSTYS